MTMRTRLSASMPFAHLFGLTARAEDEDEKSKRARRAENDDDEDLEDDEDDKDAKGRKAKGKRADEGDDEDLEGDKDDKDAKGRKAKGKRAEEGDDEDLEDEEDDKSAKSKKAIVASERVRCARILTHGLKAGNAEQACVFAFDTNMSATSAISALNAAGAAGGRGGGLAERMKKAQVPNAGAGGGDELPAGASPVAQRIIAAAARAQGR